MATLEEFPKHDSMSQLSNQKKSDVVAQDPIIKSLTTRQVAH